jgi:hypothetical protein
MTEKLTIKDLNCGNCTIETCDKHPKNRPSPKHPLELRQWYTTANATIEEVGCARHPLALQVLAAPVIEELERRVAEYQETAKRIECSHPSYVASGIEEAIKLLKGGVPP